MLPLPESPALASHNRALRSESAGPQKIRLEVREGTEKGDRLLADLF